MEKCPSIKNIALILDTADEVQRNMIHGIIRESRRGDPWNLMIANPRMSSPSAVFGSGNTPAGIIAKVATLKTSSWLANTGLPAVLLDPPDSENEVGAPLHKFPRVLCDSEAVGLKMANCFILNGFKNFAFYGPQDEGNWCKWRRMAFQKEVRRIGASCLLYREAPHPPCGEQKRKSLAEWIFGLPKPIAIFAADDHWGRRLIDVCNLAGVSIPEEVSITGVNNDTLLCNAAFPSLSSIELDAEEAGAAAARLLAKAMSGTLSSSSVVFYGAKAHVFRNSSVSFQKRDRLVIGALEYIRANRGLDLRVYDVACYMRVSARCLEKHFAMTLGHTVHDEIQGIRAKAMADLVKDRRLPLFAIAQTCGFSGTGHLRVAFHKAFGMSPSQYRDLHANPHEDVGAGRRRRPLHRSEPAHHSSRH